MERKMIDISLATKHSSNNEIYIKDDDNKTSADNKIVLKETIIPDEIISIIATYSDIHGINKMLIVCKKWNQIVDNNIIWGLFVKILSQNNSQTKMLFQKNYKNELKKIIKKNINFQKLLNLGANPFINLKNQINYLNKRPCINNLNLMQSFLHARDLLNIGLELKQIPNTVGNIDTCSTDSVVENFISTAEKMVEWLNNNKLILSQETELNFNNCHLITLPAEISQFFPNLRVLNLTENRITSVPVEISQLSNLTELSLGCNKITSVPPEIYDLENLETLCLNHNKITSIPVGISQLSNLKYFSIGNNKITSVSSEIYDLKSLETLSFWSSDITLLPDGISKLSNLKNLSLGYCNITSLPIDFFQLVSMERLDLEYTRIPVLPSDIFQLTNLVKLNLKSHHLFWISLPEGFWESPLRYITHGIPDTQIIAVNMKDCFNEISAFFSKVPDLQDWSQEKID
jgi:hypothetical protein